MSEEKKVTGRRGFLRGALITAGSVAGFLGTVRFDAKDGIKIGKTTVSVGMSEAAAACGFAANCAGGGGECGFAADCAGGQGDGGKGSGGGQCGFSANCAGGGGMCGFAADCAGGGGKCGFSANCAGS